jgi:hypothetical protein
VKMGLTRRVRCAFLLVYSFSNFGSLNRHRDLARRHNGLGVPPGDLEASLPVKHRAGALRGLAKRKVMLFSGPIIELRR